MQVARVIQLIERVLVEVGHQAPSIALGHLRQIASTLEGLHLQCSMVHCTYSGALMDSTLPPTMLAFNCFATCQFASPGMPAGLATYLIRYVKERLVSATIGSIVNMSALVQNTWFRGEHWLQQIASQVTLTYKGHCNFEDGIANPCQTLATALAKALHWYRQGHIEASAELSALFWRPTIEATSSELKTQSGRGGQANWHNTSYIGSSYCGIISAGPDGLHTFSNVELENCFSVNLRLSAKQCSIGYLQDCYSCYAGSGVHRHLIFPLALAGVEKVPQLATIGDRNEEEEIGQHIAPVASRIATENAQVRLTLPHGIEAIVTHE
ncbi:FCPC [Symbiodinium necroappetens]|uniref:FCPC protein n=1 Tax=Symbiodinium necroappetens TaxID=1628268 RepID=A0A813BRF9_9DINO|nr:FCPC [Symbiodinium necroappetens]